MGFLLTPFPAVAAVGWIVVMLLAAVAGVMGAPQPSSADDRAGASLLRAGIWVGGTGLAAVSVLTELEPAYAGRLPLILPTIAGALAIVTLMTRDGRRSLRAAGASVRRHLGFVIPATAAALAAIATLAIAATRIEVDPEAGIPQSLGLQIAPLGLAFTAACADFVLRLSSEHRATRFGVGSFIEFVGIAGVLAWVVLQGAEPLHWLAVAVLAAVGVGAVCDYAFVHPMRRTNSVTAGYAAAIMVAVSWAGLVFIAIVALIVWIRLTTVPRRRRAPIGPSFARAMAAPLACAIGLALLRFDAFLLH